MIKIELCTELRYLVISLGENETNLIAFFFILGAKNQKIDTTLADKKYILFNFKAEK